MTTKKADIKTITKIYLIIFGAHKYEFYKTNFERCSLGIFSRILLGRGDKMSGAVICILSESKFIFKLNKKIVN
jgi:hypothetical protein